MERAEEFAKQVLGSFKESHKEEILIVDDDEDFRKAISRVVSSAGYRVISVGSALEMLVILKETKPSLIILDIRMSWLNGLDLTRGLKINPKYKKIPIIAISGFANPELRYKIAKLGAEYFLEKPINNEELLNLIARILASSAS